MKNGLHRILTVEDDVSVRLNIAAFLEDCGYEVLEAANGLEGVEVFKAEKPDLVLADLHMPKLDGFGLLQQLQEISPSTPVIVVSGASDIHEAIQAIRHGAWDFLLKPIRDMSLLEHTIQKSWSRACLVQENQRYQAHLEDEVLRRTREIELAHRDLVLSQERLSQAQAIAHIGNWNWDLVRGELNWSKETYRILGLEPDSVRPGMDRLFESIHPEDRSLLHQAIRQAKDQGRSFTLSTRAVLADGSHRDLHHQCVCSLDDQGKVVRIDAICQDITESKRIEQELRIARDKAEAASRAKSNFLATMSHELRTPMNGVLGMAELLMFHTEDEKARQYAQVILTSGRALVNIIDDILDISQIETGKIEIRKQSFSPAVLLENLLRLFAASADSKELRIEMDLSPNLKQEVKGDADRINQILTNLLGNAVKFTEKGKVTLKASLREENPWQLYFEIEDSGIGIPQERIPEIFFPFTQLDDSSTRKYGGVGLGLAIVKKLLDAMQGRIEVESHLGQGSRFCLWIPVTQPPAGGAQSQAPQPEPGQAWQAQKPFRILIVEDSPTNQKVVLDLLESFHCQADVANNGVEALEAVGRKKYDLVLMDCLMPVMDGLKATKLIREKEQEEMTPQPLAIVALTAKATAGDREDCIRAGMNDYLTKPVSRETLGLVLARYLKN